MEVARFVIELASSWFARVMRGLFAVIALLATTAARAGECPPPFQMPTPDTVRQLTAQASDHGFLWKITKDGHDSWLYGTLHVGKLEWMVPGPQVRNAVQHSDTIALELDITDPGTLQRLVEYYRRDAGTIPAALKGRFKALLDKVCMPETALNEMNPVLLLNTVEVLAGRASGLESELGADAILAGYAKAGGKKVVALETPESQMELLLDSDSDDPAAELEDYLHEIERNDPKQSLDRLADAWSRGDLAVLEDYASWCQCLETDLQRADMKRLLDDRNEPMARAIDALHGQGTTVFAAVGSLHMIGRNGLPALLAKRGYIVTRIEFAP